MPINNNKGARFWRSKRLNRRPPLLALVLTLALCLTITTIIWYIHRLGFSGSALILFSGSIIALPIAILAFLLTLDHQRSILARQRNDWIQWSNRNPRRVYALHSPQLDYLYVSSTCQNVLGHTPLSLVGHRLTDFVYPHDQDNVQKAVEHAKASGYEGRAVYRFLQGNNTWLWVESRIDFVKLENLEGDLLIITKDHSEEWFWEESEKIRLKTLKLLEAQSRLEEVLRCIADALEVIFPEYRVFIRVKTTDTHGKIMQFAARASDDNNHPDAQPVYRRHLEVEKPGYFAELLLFKRPDTEIGYLNSRFLDNAADILKASVERYRSNEEFQLGSSVFTQSNDAIAVVEQARIYAANPAFSFLTGYREDEFIGLDEFFSFLTGEKTLGTREFYNEVHKLRHWHGEISITRRNGSRITADWTVSLMSAEGNENESKFINILRDITESKKSAELIWQNANYDTLTGLPNRYHFQSYLTKALQDSARDTQARLVLLFIDLDHFKEVNDTLGHEIGDKLLVLVAERIRSSIRAADFTARLGGDEFTALLKVSGTDNGQAERVAEKINEALRRPFIIGIEEINVSASIGLTIFPEDGQNVETLLKNADQAMYHAKAMGRDQYAWFSPEMQSQADFRRNVINALRESVLAGNMAVHYQPIVEMATAKVVRAEALVRWPEAIPGMESPARFIEFAEYAGLMGPMGEIVQQSVIRQTQIWHNDHHLELQSCINLSPKQFADPGTIPSLIAQLEGHGLSGKSIVIEITEDCFLDPNIDIKNRLEQTRGSGIELAIDGFGQGYSSLAHLSQFHFDFLKIDRAFIRELGSADKCNVVVEAMVAMAHKLGVKVVAVGIETELQHRMLLNMGCDFAQGYYYAKPMNAQAMTDYLLSRERPEEALLPIG